MSEIRNYIGGTIVDPCPTGGVFAWAVGKCARRDYLSWKLAARDVWREGIEPTWVAYADAQVEGWEQDKDPLWLAVESWRERFNMLPTVPWYATPTEREYAVQMVVSLMVAGDNLVTRLQEGIEAAGQVPPPVPEPPPINLGEGGVNLPIPQNGDDTGWPWWAWALTGVAVVGTTAGITYAATRKGKR